LLFNFVMHCIISTVVVAFEINYLILSKTPTDFIVCIVIRIQLRQQPHLPYLYDAADDFRR